MQQPIRLLAGDAGLDCCPSVCGSLPGRPKHPPHYNSCWNKDCFCNGSVVGFHQFLSGFHCCGQDVAGGLQCHICDSIWGSLPGHPKHLPHYNSCRNTDCFCNGSVVGFCRFLSGFHCHGQDVAGGLRWHVCDSIFGSLPGCPKHPPHYNWQQTHRNELSTGRPGVDGIGKVFADLSFDLQRGDNFQEPPVMCSERTLPPQRRDDDRLRATTIKSRRSN
jgi:hypothetical protein